MLTLHGLVIIADDNIREIPNKFGCTLQFQVASENDRGGTVRHFIDVFVPMSKLADAKQKIKVGTVWEITSGKWTEQKGSYLNQDSNKQYSKVVIKVKWDDFRALGPCIYYEGVDQITETKKEGPTFNTNGATTFNFGSTNLE